MCYYVYSVIYLATPSSLANCLIKIWNGLPLWCQLTQVILKSH